MINHFISKLVFNRMDIIYENIDNIHLKNDTNLISDLKKRLGVEVKLYKIHKVDYLKDIADITIYY